MHKALTIASRVRVSFTRSTGTVRDWCFARLINQQRRDGCQGIHLLSHAVTAVVLLFPPVETAGAAVGFPGAGLDGGFGRDPEHGEDGGRRVGRYLGDVGEPAVHVALEGKHVGCAPHGVFAGGLVGDLFGEEADEGGVDEVVDAVFPDLGFGLWGLALWLEDGSEEKDIRSCTCKQHQGQRRQSCRRTEHRRHRCSSFQRGRRRECSSRRP